MAWQCAYTEPDARCEPDAVVPATRWYAASVPGTAAGALLDAGEDLALLRDYDRYEWWFRGRFTLADDRAHRLHLGGLATLADVWLDGAHLLHSENMFVAHDLEVAPGAGEHELLVRLAPLADRLAARRPRAALALGAGAHPEHPLAAHDAAGPPARMGRTARPRSARGERWSARGPPGRGACARR